MKKIALKSIKLCPLRIPTGWIMTYNNFLELNPAADIEVTGTHENNPWNLFTQDLLQISHQNFPFTIDLGWYPAASPDGYYHSVLIKKMDWDIPYRDVKTRNRQEVIDEIEKWMDELVSSYGIISP